MKLVSDVAEAKDAGDFARIMTEHVSDMYAHILNTAVGYSQRVQDILRGGSKDEPVRPQLSMNTPSKAPANTPSKAPAASDRTSTCKGESLDICEPGLSRLKVEPYRIPGRQHLEARNDCGVQAGA